jgi:predicted ArsR family transcriptional regulator
MPNTHVDNVRLLKALKKKHGSLNAALVREYALATGERSIRAISLSVGLSRTAVRRHLEGLSEKNRPRNLTLDRP